MVLTKKTFNQLATERRSGRVFKKISFKFDRQTERLSRIKLKDEYPKYFWEFITKHNLTPAIIKEAKVSLPAYDKLVQSFKARGQKMFSKLFSYKKDATYDVEYAPYTVVLQGKELSKPKWPKYFNYDPACLLSDILTIMQSGKMAIVSSKRVQVFPHNKIQTGNVMKVDVDMFNMCHDNLFYFSRTIDPKHILGWLRDLTTEGIEPNPGPKTLKRMKKRKPGNRNKTSRAIQPRNYRPKNTTNDFPLIRTQIQPQHVVLEFSYDLLSSAFNNPGGSQVSELYYSNDAYDWLPSILTQAMMFLNRTFQLYAKAKVIDVSFNFCFDNLEQTAIDLMFFSGPQPLTSVSSSKSALEYAMATGIYRGGCTMSEQYGKCSKVTFTDYIKIGKVLGNTIQYKSSEAYTFTQSSGPPSVTYYSWVASSPLSTVSTGFTRRARLVSRILFYELLTLPSQLLDPSLVNPRSKRDRKTFQNIVPPVPLKLITMGDT